MGKTNCMKVRWVTGSGKKGSACWKVRREGCVCEGKGVEANAEVMEQGSCTEVS